MRNRSRSIKDQRHIEKRNRKAVLKHFGSEIATLIERGWAAGFFDGEGSTSVRERGGVSCSIEQTISGEKQSPLRDTSNSVKGLLNLERFHRIVGGAGRIKKRKHRRRGAEQATCQWIATSQESVNAVAKVIGPFLGPEKQRQFSRALIRSVQTALAHDRALPGLVVASVTVHRKKRSPEGAIQCDAHAATGNAVLQTSKHVLPQMQTTTFQNALSWAAVGRRNAPRGPGSPPRYATIALDSEVGMARPGARVHRPPP